MSHDRLSLHLIAAGAILCAVAGASVYGSFTWSAVANDAARRYRFLSDLDRTAAALVDAETGQRGFLITGKSEYLADFYRGSKEARQRLIRLEASTSSVPESASGLRRLRSLVESNFEELDRNAILRLNLGLSQAQAILAQGESRAAMNQLRLLIETIRSRQQEILSRLQSQMRTRRLWTDATSLAGSLLAVLVVLLATLHSRNSTREALQAQQGLDAFMRHNPSVAFIKDAAGRILYANAAFERLFHFRRQDWLNKTDFELWPADLAKKFRDVDIGVLAGHSALEVIEQVILPDGEIRDFLSIKFPFRQGGDLLLGGIAFDLTQRRIEAATLKASEEFTRSILQSSSDCIKVLDREGRLLSMNENGRLLMKIPDLSVVLWKEWPAFWSGAGHQAALGAIAAALRGETAKFEGLCPDFDQAQRWWDVVVSPIRGGSGDISKLLVVSRDITEMKTAELQLRNSELRYRSLFEQNPLPACIYSAKTLEFLDVNQTAVSHYGYSLREFLGMRLSDLLAPRSDWSGEPLPESHKPKRSGPWQHRRKDGTQLTVETTTQQIAWHEEPAYLVMVHDISEQLASEEKFRCLFEKSGDAILLTADGTVVDCNPSAVSMLRAQHKSQVVGMTPPQLLAPVQPDGSRGEEVAAAMREETARNGSLRRDLLHRRLNGEEFLVDLSMTGVEIQGRHMRLVIWHDLTDRNKAEEAVRKSEMRLRAAQQIAGMGSWEFSEETGFVEWSDETYRIFGIKRAVEPLSPSEIGLRIHPEDRARVVQHRHRTIHHGDPYDLEYRVVWESGEVRYVHSLAQPFTGAHGKLTGLSGTVLDITQRRRITEALRASEARFHAFMENSPALAFIKDRDGRMVYMNRICQTMWNLDRVDWQGKTDAELWSPELAREFRKLDLAVLDSGIAGSNVDVVPLPNGQNCSLLSSKFRLSLETGESLLAGISLDITDQKEAEQKALAALADKEVLLKEVHHRVKNNLQIICSLLGMQADGIEDADTVAALRESQNRVQSMAMIHELLYGSDSLRDVDFREYVERLATELDYSYGLGSRVRLRVDMVPVHFTIGQAIPCGLILNELISNSLKYAFPDERPGEVTVSLSDEGADHISLAVEDDGVGLSPQFQLDTGNSLGLRIVQILTRQLEGTLSVSSTGKTRFQIVFPMKSCETAVGLPGG